MNAHCYPSEQATLLAFHYKKGCIEYTPYGESREIGSVVYEVTETVQKDGTCLYEGWIYDAATREMILKRPYQSTWVGAFDTWWRKETGTEPPEELLSRRGYAHDEGKDR